MIRECINTLIFTHLPHSEGAKNLITQPCPEYSPTYTCCPSACHQCALGTGSIVINSLHSYAGQVAMETTGERQVGTSSRCSNESLWGAEAGEQDVCSVDEPGELLMLI